MANITFITSNTAKVQLATERLKPYGIVVDQATLALEEVQSFDVAEVATKKAQHAMSKMQSTFFVEDSGFYIKTLQGFPGPLIKPVMQSLGEDRLTGCVGSNENRDVEVISVIALGDPTTGAIKTFQGTYPGTLAEYPRGDAMRGWLLSRVFIPHGWDQTLAEMDEVEWSRFLDDFRDNDHFEKLGRWLTEQNTNHRS